MVLSGASDKFAAMNIELKEVSKRYGPQWILKNINYKLSSNFVYGIRGANGSGKSTLLKMISGFLSPSLGQISYSDSENSEISRDEIYKKCSFWGPHVDLYGKLTVDEMINYYFTFKGMRNSLSKEEFLDIMNLPVSRTRRVDSLSSGQVQRLGLAMTILCDSELLLLDEPGSYLDIHALEWFSRLIKSNSKNRLIVIASNEENDLALSEVFLQIEDFK